jgi:hypothetical protein
VSQPPGVPPIEQEDGLGASVPSLDPPLGEGDDDALILWFLSLSVAERIAVAQDFVDSATVLKHGLRA